VSERMRPARGKEKRRKWIGAWRRRCRTSRRKTGDSGLRGMPRRRTGARRSSHVSENGPGASLQSQTPRYAMFGCLCAMSDTPLRDVRVPVRDVRHPVTRCSGACARCQTPRYAMFGCLCAMSDTPLRDARVLVRDVRAPVRDVNESLRDEWGGRADDSRASTLVERRYMRVIGTRRPRSAGRRGRR
jgi:hypothetical protein